MVAWGRQLLTEVADLVWPAQCAGCGRRGTPWCPHCAADLAASTFDGGPRLVRPRPAPPGLPPVWAWASYDGLVRSTIVVYKDRDRRDLARILIPLLAEAVASALSAVVRWPVLVVPVPATSAAVRRRGDRPLETLGRGAVRLLDPRGQHLVWAPCLRTVRALGDQAGLDAAARRTNLSGAFAVSPRWRKGLAATDCLVIDDVVTTGATLADAARAIRDGGGEPRAGATLAATARRHPPR